MKLIEQARAPNPRRVRIFLAEKGITVPAEQIDIMKLDHRAAGFSSLNPWQQVPVLVLDDGTAIAETMAICRYLEELNPEPCLFGASPKERAIVEMWNRRVELGLFLRVAQTFRHTHPAMAELEKPQVAQWGEVNRARAIEQASLLDGELANRRFIAGDRYSVADITALVAVDFMKVARIERPASLVNLARWHAEASARPSAKAQ